MPLEFAVLGDLLARRGGRELPLGSPQQRGVLALLLLRAGRLVSPEELIDRHVGREPAHERACHDPHLHLAAAAIAATIRRQDHSVIESTAGGYRLPVTQETLDLVLFE